MKMRLEQSLPLLGLLLCMVGTTAQQDDTEALKELLVEISGTTVTVTCPSLEPPVSWRVNDEQKSNETKLVLQDPENFPLNITCSSKERRAEMYLNAKVCANCEELDALAVAGIITADLLITFGVLILVYYFSKDRKGRASTSAGSRPRGQKMQRPPPVPNPDYEPIRKGQREVYAGLESRGF